MSIQHVVMTNITIVFFNYYYFAQSQVGLDRTEKWSQSIGVLLRENGGKNYSSRKWVSDFKGHEKLQWSSLKNRFRSHIPREEASVWPRLCIFTPGIQATYPFINVYAEHLRCARCDSRCWGHSSRQSTQNPCCQGASTLKWGDGS